MFRSVSMGMLKIVIPDFLSVFPSSTDIPLSDAVRVYWHTWALFQALRIMIFI